MLLGDVSKIKTGNLDVNAKVENGRYPFFTCARRPEKIDSYSFDCECVLVAGNGDLNVKYYEGKFDVYQRTYVIEVLRRDRLDTRFLFYFLNKYLEKLRSQSIGGVIKYIKMANLTDIKLPNYSLEKQKQIVETLDTADSLRQKRKEQLALLDDYLKSVFLDMFGDNKKYPHKKMVELAEERKGSMRTGPFGSTLKHSEFVDQGIAVLGIDNAVDNEFKWKRMRYITSEKYEYLKQYTVYPGDVLITIMGTLGRSAVVPDGIPIAINTKHLACISLNIRIANPYFISYSVVNDPYITHQLKGNTRGAIMGGLNLTIIKDLKMNIPPLNLQNKFVSVMKQVEKTKQKMRASLDEMDNHFNALMQRCFG